MKYSLDTNYVIGILNPNDRLSLVSKNIVSANNSAIMVLLVNVLREYALKFNSTFFECAKKFDEAVFTAEGKKRGPTEIIANFEKLKKTAHPHSIFYGIIFERFSQQIFTVGIDKFQLTQELSHLKITLTAGIAKQIQLYSGAQTEESQLWKEEKISATYTEYMKITSTNVNFNDRSDQSNFCEAAAFCKTCNEGMIFYTDDNALRKTAKSAISELELAGLKNFEVRKE